MISRKLLLSAEYLRLLEVSNCFNLKSIIIALINCICKHFYMKSVYVIILDYYE